tara:strand:+ start:852 stop:1265 length:414 start_codon:yes stop_codon:yes gene_type:complete
MRFPIIGVLMASLIFSTSVAYAQEEQSKGGVVPAAVSCMVGPRVGLEMNEGIPVETTEWLGLVFFPIRALPGYQDSGVTGALIGAFLGPRVGGQYSYRNVRTKEWLGLLIGPILPALEAFQGKTMTEIEEAEGLRKS